MPSFLGENMAEVGHRRFEVTLGKAQVLKSFKASLRQKEFSKSHEQDLLTTFRALVEQLIEIDEENLVVVFRAIRPQIEKYYKKRGG